MKKTTLNLTAAIVVGVWGSSHAAVTPEEAKLLGTTLTTWGAEVAGNKDGSIPAYAGGVTKLPAGFVEGKVRPDPFANDKPLFSIDAKNMDKYADKLTEGTKALMRKFPKYRVDVYPTRRSVAYPEWVMASQLKNATRCKAINDGLSVEGCHGGTPFPIPKTGNEAMWNHLLRYGGNVNVFAFSTVYVDAAGKQVKVAQSLSHQEYPYYDPKKTSADYSWMIRSEVLGPARSAGERTIVLDPLDWVKEDRKVWKYMPGQRRVRSAPDLAYDTPSPNTGGTSTMDDAEMFLGKLDRFDWKLVGKKEVYVPYNVYKLQQTPDDKFFTPDFPNPDAVRFELHRMWVVEATLKPGKRHVYHKRTFYLDEDSWAAIISDQYDAAGKLYRSSMGFCSPRYEVPAPTCSDTYGNVDHVNGVYAVVRLGPDGYMWNAPPLPSRSWNPDSLSGGGIR